MREKEPNPFQSPDKGGEFGDGEGGGGQREATSENRESSESFVQLTERTMERLKEWQKESPGDLPKKIYDYARNKASDPHEFDLIPGSHHLEKQLAVSLASTLDANFSEDNIHPEFSRDDLSFLEIGGYHASIGPGDDKEGWVAAQYLLYNGNVDYTGIDIDPDPQTVGSRLYSDHSYERLQMDVFDLPNKLATRKYKVVFAQGFFGEPTAQAARNAGVSSKQYHKQIIGTLDKMLEDGGVMIFINREGKVLSEKEFSDFGYDAVVTEQYISPGVEGPGSPFVIARKLPSHP